MPRAEWLRRATSDPVTNPSLAAEGFIHCTDDEGVLLRVANAFYADEGGEFVVLDVDVDALSSPCVWEDPAHPSPGAEPFAPTFPHVYGPIDAAAVVRVREVRRDRSGAFIGYGESER